MRPFFVALCLAVGSCVSSASAYVEPCFAANNLIQMAWGDTKPLCDSELLSAPPRIETTDGFNVLLSEFGSTTSATACRAFWHCMPSIASASRIEAVSGSIRRILFCRSKIQVVRANTYFVVTAMTHAHSVGDCTEMNHPREPMCHVISPIRSSVSSFYASIAASNSCPDPSPASFCFVDEQPESFLWFKICAFTGDASDGILAEHLKSPISGATPQAATNGAEVFQFYKRNGVVQ